MPDEYMVNNVPVSTLPWRWKAMGKERLNKLELFEYRTYSPFLHAPYKVTKWKTRVDNNKWSAWNFWVKEDPYPYIFPLFHVLMTPDSDTEYYPPPPPSSTKHTANETM